MQRPDPLAQRWVVKVGSSLLTANGRGLDHAIIEQWTTQIAALLDDGKEVVLVSSGSIAEGMSRLGWTTRPTLVHELQAAAAVGQMGLIQAYESGFKRFNRNTAQVLLTHEDMANRKRYLNARATLNSLVKFGVVPIVNENDTVTTAEIKLGDNDTLAAQVVNLIEADLLVLLTDQDGLFNKDPRKHEDAVLLDKVNANDESVLGFAGPSGSAIGSGGMHTKILAAQRAAKSGASTIIASGREPDVLLRLSQGASIGTMLTSDTAPQDARKRWLSSQLRVKGELWLDAGAIKKLREHGSSLLAVGVTKVGGSFHRGELVACMDEHGVECARGLVNYNSDETAKILGKPSGDLSKLLGYEGEPELIHRDNMILS